MFRDAFLATAFLVTAATAAAQTWVNSLQPPPGPEELVLAQLQPHPDGALGARDQRWDPGRFRWPVANYDIVIPARATPQEQKAAYELSRWLGEISGAAFDVILDSRPRTRHEISVGQTSRLGAANLPRPDLGDEGYSIAVKNGDLFLAGGARRGPLYAVFALLEEDLGCRWYPLGVTRIPHMPELRFRPAPRSFLPTLEGREPFYWSALSPEWSLRNRTNSHQVPLPEEWGGHMFWARRTHSFKEIVPPETYFAAHPEYYGLRGGQRVPDRLCLTNPALLPIAIENVRRILRENPSARAINIAKEDGGTGECDCERCTRFNREHGSPAAAHVAFVNAIAAALEAEFPRVIFCTYAYTYTLEPPTGIVARRNVGIRLCNSDSSHPFRSVADSPEYQRIQAGWRKVTDKIFIYDYWDNWSHMLLPYPDTDMIARNIRYFAETGALEVSGLGTAARCKAGDRDAMFAWVTAKLLWNPAWDVRALMRDFAMGYYGAAGHFLADYDDLLETAYRKVAGDPAVREPKLKRRFDATLPLYQPEFLAQANRLFDRAEQAAGNEQVRGRVQMVRLGILYVQLEKGPEATGPAYGDMLRRFAEICRRQGVESINQGNAQLDLPTLSEKLADWGSRWQAYAHKPSRP